MDAYGRACSSHDSAETGAGAGVGFVFACGLLVLIALLFQRLAPFPLCFLDHLRSTLWYEAARHATGDEHTRQLVCRSRSCLTARPIAGAACRAENRSATYNLNPKA